MRLSRRLAPLVILVVLVSGSLAMLRAAAIAPVVPFATDRGEMPLTVHEWGTFTSIAGTDGRAEEWAPLSLTSDLPCFVERFNFSGGKGTLGGTVRMETPVLYFYAPGETTVSVNVRFRHGAITEWYPRAAVNPLAVGPDDIGKPEFVSTAAWSNVHLTPEAAASDLAVEPGHSHYYLARETDAAALQVGDQREKFLFYRGVGAFQPPVSATLTDDRTIIVNSASGEPLGDLIVFENRAGKVGYQVLQTGERQSTLAMPILTAGAAPPLAELEQLLIARGLFPREARAMVDTWRDPWFEPGVRLFYVAPRRTIDAILPLQISPAPVETARVFVGRIELFTPWIVQDARRAIDDRDTAKLLAYGRFMVNIAHRILEPTLQKGTPEEQKVWLALAPAIEAQWKARRPCESRPPAAGAPATAAGGF